MSPTSPGQSCVTQLIVAKGGERIELEARNHLQRRVRDTIDWSGVTPLVTGFKLRYREGGFWGFSGGVYYQNNTASGCQAGT